MSSTKSGVAPVGSAPVGVLAIMSPTTVLAVSPGRSENGPVAIKKRLSPAGVSPSLMPSDMKSYRRSFSFGSSVITQLRKVFKPNCSWLVYTFLSDLRKPAESGLVPISLNTTES